MDVISILLQCMHRHSSRTHSPSDSPSLSNPVVRQSIPLRFSRLLVGSSSGLSRKYFAQRPSRSSSRVRAWPDFVLLVGRVRNISAPRFRPGSQTKDECSKAGSLLRSKKSSHGAIDLNECHWQSTKTVRDARKTKRSSPKPADGLQQLAKDLVNPYCESDGKLKPGVTVDTSCPTHYADTDGECMDEPPPLPAPKPKPRKKATRITPESAETKYIFTLVARKLWPQFQRYVKDTRPHLK
jgi:hypothetical protein